MPDREQELGHRWTIIGPLAKIFDNFDTPLPFREAIGRRTGALAGTPHLPYSDIEEVITKSMMVNGGMPDWPGVHENLCETVKDEYRKLKR